MTDKRPRNSSGQLEIEYKDSDFIKIIKDKKQASSTEIASSIGCHKTVCLYRLKSLIESKQISGEKVSGRWIFTIPKE